MAHHLALVLDISNSMNEEDAKNGESRIQALQAETTALLESMAFFYEIGDFVGKLGIITFNSEVKVLKERGTVDVHYLQEAYDKIKKIDALSSTNTRGAIKRAKKMLKNIPKAKSSMVMITDGVYNYPVDSDEANPYKEWRDCPKIYLVFQGKEDEHHHNKIEIMEQLAKKTGGKPYKEQDPKKISILYRQVIWHNMRLARVESFADLVLNSGKESLDECKVPLSGNFFVETTVLKSKFSLITDGKPQKNQILVDIRGEDKKPVDRKNVKIHPYTNSLFIRVTKAKKQKYTVSFLAGPLELGPKEKNHVHCLSCFASQNQLAP